MDPDLTIIVNRAAQPVDLADGTRFPSAAVVTVHAASSPPLLLSVAVEDGRPELVELALARPADGARLTTAMLRRLPLDKLVHAAVRALAEHAWLTGQLRGGDVDGVADALYQRVGLRARTAVLDDLDRAGSSATTVRRRNITSSLLREVAEVVEANPIRPTEAVAQTMHTSHRNASRWIAQARELGLLEEGR